MNTFETAFTVSWPPTYFSGTSATPLPTAWTQRLDKPRPLSEQMVLAFCRLHDAATNLTEAWQ